ncbi:DUF4352 domain-containing protein [Shouchella lehensis]|uniref:DUF4352 domain-containing protein n=1 Tax=Shouchella lehensis TaxID=300825 RepID=A0A4Y7WJ79_9BACI|nr:DUF4352 domain-containing protein [Shouchella lehensis]MBG9785933.1 hypothetical protein [Shouchella lehensis]RQW20236.1 DUF4352 domain-containing protein [Bacillus sp. C1-1]TES48409.1 DUF4352 domain-containing protein [Shouchella lehensis]
MKRTTSLIATMVAIPFILGACSDSDDGASSAPAEESSTTDDAGTDEDSENETDDTGTPAEEGEDQLDLVVGDTAIMESNVASFEFTLNSVEMVEEIDGEMPELDAYIIASITIKNVGDEPIDALETSRTFEYTDFLEGSGMPDDSEWYDEYDGVEGEIAPGDEMTGTAVYQGYIDEENHLRVKPGLTGISAINDAMFTFTRDELEN